MRLAPRAVRVLGFFFRVLSVLLSSGVPGAHGAAEARLPDEEAALLSAPWRRIRRSPMAAEDSDGSRAGEKRIVH